MIKRECHKCELNGRGDPRCIDCPGPADVSLKGRRMVYPDGQPNPAGIYSQRIDAQREVRGSVTTSLTQATEDALVRILASILEFDDLDWAILKRKYQGKDGSQIAREIGTSKQVVHFRLKRLVKPGAGGDCEGEVTRRCIAMAIVDMKRRGVGGARRGVYRSGFVQPELFGQEEQRHADGH